LFLENSEIQCFLSLELIVKLKLNFVVFADTSAQAALF